MFKKHLAISALLCWAAVIHAQGTFSFTNTDSWATSDWNMYVGLYAGDGTHLADYGWDGGQWYSVAGTSWSPWSPASFTSDGAQYMTLYVQNGPSGTTWATDGLSLDISGVTGTFAFSPSGLVLDGSTTTLTDWSQVASSGLVIASPVPEPSSSALFFFFAGFAVALGWNGFGLQLRMVRQAGRQNPEM